MGVYLYDLRDNLILYHSNTVGGGTYTVDGEPICLERLRDGSGSHCSLKAGMGTDHPGTGRCKYHGGCAGHPIEHGRYAKVARNRLHHSYIDYIEDPDLMNLTPELVILRSLLDEAIMRFEEHGTTSEIKLCASLVDSITKLVDKIDTIQSRHVLTVSSIRYLMLRAMDVAGRFIDVEQLPVFIDAWENDVQSIFSGVNSDLKQLEHSDGNCRLS